MTKKELRDFSHLKKSIQQNEKLLQRLERQADSVPAVKDKVQSSQKEWPFIQTHLTVDAPEPRQFSRIQYSLIRCRKELERQQAQEMELQARLLEFIGTLTNIRDRYIIKAVFLEERDQKEIAIDLDLTEGRISQIIDEILQQLN